MSKIAFLLILVVTLVVVQCQEEPCSSDKCPIEEIVSVKNEGRFSNSWHQLNEKEMFGTTCETTIKGTSYHSKWRWEGKFWCPSLSAVQGYSKSLESREAAIEHAIADYKQKGQQLGFLTESQLQNVSDVESDPSNISDRKKSRHARDLDDQNIRENQTLVYENAIYYGDTLNNVEHGVGAIAFKSGAKYAGGWSHGQMHGIGIYYFASGARYVGQFQSNMIHGYGILTGPTGYQYKGDFLVNKKWGYGEETWTDGDKFIGRFQNDERHGVGYWIFASGKRRAAIYIDGKEI